VFFWEVIVNLRTVSSIAILLLYASTAIGQATNSADLTGTITDSSGAVVPGVTITVKDLDKGVEHTYITNGAGLYDTGPLFPDDHYVVTFAKEGFATLQRGPMVLRVGRIGLDTKLDVGQTAQKIEVSDAAPLLETATSELSTTLPLETLQALPQGGSPDWQQFIVLQPGVQGNSSNAPNPGMGGASANGSLPYSSSLLDGAMENSPQADNVIIIPVFDAIAEVKISDSLFSAQFPTGGILYNQITKGGTNKIHGMAYDYLRNTAFNAASYAFGTGRISPIHFNDFGFNLGGPVLKNRLFLFFDWDHAINHGLGAPAFISVPTPAMLAGDFTGMATVYDPATQTVNPATGVVTRRSYADEYGLGNKIPANLISPVANAVQSYFPAANLPGTVNNYQYQLPSSSTVQKYFGRVDMDITHSNRITGSVAESLNHTLSNSPVCPINCYSNATSNVSTQLSDFWTISSNTLNEARVGFYAEYDDQRYSTLNQGYPAKLGLKFAKVDVFPTINITGIYSFGPGVYFIDKENLFDISDTVTLIRGRHSIHVGGQFVPERVDANPYSGLSSASLSFSGGYTGSSNGVTGTPYADFLLGYAKSWSAANYPEYGGRLKNGAAFFQDDWKFTPKLTLNLGLRYELRTGWSEVHNNMRLFDPTITNPATNTLGAMWYASTHVNGRTAAETSRYNNWYPRVGFAYQASPKLTIRGGFGIYAYQWNANWDNPGVGQAAGSSGSQSDSTNNIAPVVTLDNDGNTNFQGSKGSAINALYKNAPNQPDSYNGQGVGFQTYQSPIPVLREWNADFQRELSTNMVAEIAYVGSHGANLPFTIDINQVPESLLSPTDSGSRPYPQYQSITGFSPVGYSNYNALEVSVSRRMSHGLEFNGNYTWSHMLSNQDSSGWNSLQGPQTYQRAYDPKANYGASNFDVRNAVKGQVIYQLPFGSGQMFINKNTLLNEIIGGLSLSTTVVAQGGHPFTPTMLVNNSYSLSSGVWYPNQVGNPQRSDKGINGWFNTNAFQSPTPGTYGNLRRNNVYGPGFSQVNAALHKSFALYEHVKFDLSANATNVLNHASFGQPDASIGVGHTATIRSVTVGGRTMELVGKIIF
jgi:hypothetical protein